MSYDPVIKWSGSKRSQADNIISNFPKEIKTYYESFCGGASVFRKLLDSDIHVDKYVLSDVNEGLIDLWKATKDNPILVADHYEKLWNELNQDDDKDRKKKYFAEIRGRYNRDRNPLDFMFIMRTTTNGMPRYNKNGEFNNSFHVTRNGIMPDSLRKIINEWIQLISNNNVQFVSCSYEKIQPSKDDYMYLDPPYFNTKGMYYETIDYQNFWNYLRNIPCRYAFSFDGVSGNIDNTYNVPKDIYSEHLYLRSGNSSFKRTIGKSNDSIVFESLYLKR